RSIDPTFLHRELAQWFQTIQPQVAGLKEDQRPVRFISLGRNDLAETESMASTVKGFQEFTIKVGLTSFENRGPGHGGCPLATLETITLTLLMPPCKTVCQICLVLAENAHGEHVSSFDEPLGPGVLGQRHHDGQRRDGNGTERIASHSVDFISVAAADNGYSRYKSRHDFAKMMAV